MLQPMVPEKYREDHKHCDGGASLLHIGISLYGERFLRFWEKDVEAPWELQHIAGQVYISSPACFTHQALHRDGSPSDLMAFTGLSSNLVKYAVQIRCELFLQARGTTPPASPPVAFQAAAEVVAHWLVEAKIRLPSLAEIADLRGGNQEWWKGQQNSPP